MAEKLPEEVGSRRLDKTGKTVFDGIYDAPDPRSYYAVMQALDYRIPMQALPFFTRLFTNYRHANSQQEVLNVLDLGSSYGVNAALLKWHLTLQDLYAHYAGNIEVDFATLLSHDREYFASCGKQAGLAITGFDVSENALQYATQAGLLDQAVCLNLEENEADARQGEIISSSDCVISSGCIGYITETSLEKILELCSPRRPWMAHCILRMVSTEPFEALLRERGYRVWQESTLLPQRRFASEEEQVQMLGRLREQGIDPQGYEAEGWLYARVLMAVP